MGAEKVRDGAQESFRVEERVLGLGVTGLGNSGCGVCEVRCWGFGVECGRVSFDVLWLNTVHDLSP